MTDMKKFSLLTNIILFYNFHKLATQGVNSL